MNNSFVPYSLFAPISRALRLKKTSKSFCALLCNLSLVLNIFLPYFAAIPAYAEEPSPTPIVESTPAPTADPTITEAPAEPTVAPTETPVEPTATPTAEPAAEPTAEPTLIPTNTPEPTTPAVTSTPTDSSSPAPVVTETPSVTVTPSPSPTSIPVSGQIKTSVVPNNSCRTDLLNPFISSDKADYSPSEIAIISGSGFAVNTDYLLVITAEGQPSQTYNITSDSTGNFTYSYRLYDSYIPNYKVELTSPAGLVLATTLFTDSASITTTSPNVACMADQPGKTGLNCTANDTPIADVTAITINTSSDGHKGCRWPGDTVDFTATWEIQANANQRYDLGLWFATQGQPSALHGTCSVTSLPSSPSPFFDAGGTSKCGDINNSGTGTLQITMSAVCNPDANGLLKLPYCSSWNQNSDNSCQTPVDTLPGTAAKCKCDDGFTIDIPVPPSIEVVKDLSPTDDPGKFNLSVNGNPETGTNVGNGGKTGKIVVNIGNNAIAETAGTATSLSNYSSDVSCVLRNTQTPVAITGGTNPWTLNVSNGQDIVCTITNTRINNGSITIVKNSIPDSSQSFSFTTSGVGISNFTLADVGGTASIKFSDLASGTYSVAETPITGWTQTSATCDDGSPVSAINLFAGENVICTFTNTLQKANLTLVKNVIKDNGGDAQITDWTLSATGPTNISGISGYTSITNAQVTNGTYTLAESSGPSGYIASNWECTNSVTVTNNQITLSPGQTTVCTITNDDIAPTLKLVKTVTNDNGGTAAPSNWTLNAVGTSGFSDAGNSTTFHTVKAGIGYTLTESTLPGYTSGTWSCDGGISPIGSVITLSPGQNITCTINNNDQQASIVLVKTVVNNNGGTATPNNFNLTLEGNPVLSGQTVPVNPGTYTAGETLLSGYSFTGFSGACDRNGDITVSLGESKTCTLTNDDIAPSLTLNKIVVNDNGGTATESSWTLIANGGTIGTLSGLGAVGTTDVVSESTFKAGTYTLSESEGPAGYTASSWNCIGGTMPDSTHIALTLGQSATCTITNNDIAPSLHLIKTITNDNGGTAAATTWTLTAAGVKANPTNLSGITQVNSDLNFKADTYSLGESGPTGYTAGNWNCVGGTMPDTNHVILTLGQSATCTINNNDNAPSLTLNKIVSNNYGGTAPESAWTLTANGGDAGILSGPGAVGDTDVVSGADFKAGTYTLSESPGSSGYSSSSWECDINGRKTSTASVTLTLGDIATCTVTNNDQAAHLIVIKNVVNDNGGTKVAGDFSTTITDVTTANPTAPGIESPGVDNILTTVGSYSVDEGAHIGYNKNLSIGCSGTIALGETKTCTITNDDIAPSLTVIKTIINDNGGTSFINDFAIKLNNIALGFTDDGSGVFTATPTVQSNLLYTLTEADLPGYAEGAWTCTETNNPTHAISHPFTLTEGQNVTCAITNNDIYGKINVIKFNDLDGDGVMNNNDVGLSAWTINLSGETKVTGANGQITFDQLIPDTYYLSEVLQAGWTQTNIYCDQQEEVLTSAPKTIINKIIKTVNAQVAGYPVRIGESQSVNCYIGNRLLPPTTKISKFNDASGDLSPGDSVGYKIKVVIFGNDIKDLKVTDLLSNGFTYRPGTYHISVGGTDVTTQVTEPVYHSPGLWDLSTLGNLHVGDTIELSYIADISSDQQSGKYTDLAYAYGQAAYGDNAIVYADGENSQYVNNNFVGTEVPVIKSTQNSISAGVEKREEGQVLGVSTELPSTGSDSIWLIISSLMVLLGFTFLKKSSKKLIAIIFFAIFCLFPVNAQAVSNLSIRLEQPKSPTNLNDLKLTFVALDINNNPVTVKCFKKSPSDGGYSQFGSNISLNAPGNTSQCQTDSSILNSEGTYLFYVSANDTVNSDIVSVDYKTSGPGTPSNYSKDRPGYCDYKIHFRTADDGGKTVKVELYRADITNFILDAGSRVASVNIGSNQDYDITNTVPVCNKDYYYVLRAFDDAGNGSGTIGDSVTVTTTTTVGTSTVSGSTSGAIPLIGINLPSGTTEENIGETPSGGTEPGQILGTQNVTPTFLKKYWLPLALTLLIIAGIIGYVLFRKRKNSQ